MFFNYLFYQESKSRETGKVTTKTPTDATISLSHVHLGKTRVCNEPRRKLAINSQDNTVQVGMIN